MTAQKSASALGEGREGSLGTEVMEGEDPFKMRPKPRCDKVFLIAKAGQCAGLALNRMFMDPAQS